MCVAINIIIIIIIIIYAIPALIWPTFQCEVSSDKRSCLCINGGKDKGYTSVPCYSNLEFQLGRMESSN